MTAAERLLRTPFRHQSRRPGVGLDCAGVIWCAFSLGLGIELDDNREYRRVPDPALARAMLERSFVEMPGKAWLPADVVTFGLRDNRNIQHMALGARDGMVFGVERYGTVYLERPTQARMRRFVSVWRLR